MDDLTAIQARLREQWASFDADAIANDATRKLLQARGDWDPPEGVEPREPLIYMAIGIPDSETLPKQAFTASAARVLQKPGDAAFAYGFGMGYTRLRAQLAERYSRDRGIEIDEEWFQLTNGSSGAIDLICRSIVDPGDVIIAESPTYMGTLRNFRALGAEIVPVPMDEEGLRVDLLEEIVQQLERSGKRIKFLYTISNFHNPTGASLALERRIALLRLAATHKLLILDDDAYGELAFDGSPPPSLLALSGGHGVITVGTLSKVLATGLRIGWILGEPALVQMMGKMRFAMGLNQVMVRVISDWMREGALDNHVAMVRELYLEKLNLVTAALERHVGEYLSYRRPGGGFYLWGNLAQGLTAEQVWRAATREGVSVSPGFSFFPDKQDPTGEHLRIAFAWTPSEYLDEGARRLGKACARVARGDLV